MSKPIKAALLAMLVFVTWYGANAFWHWYLGIH